MSPDAPLPPRRYRAVRIAACVVLGLVAVVGLAIWLAFPWGSIDGLRVERAEVVAAPRPNGQLAPGDTPQLIAVTFSTPVDLERLRDDKGAEFVTAELSACEDADIAQHVAVAQVGGIFREGRVRSLPPGGSDGDRRYRYRAVFDDWLPVPRGSTSAFVSAVTIGGGPCFSLGGGAMWMGKLWSDRIPLTIDPPAAARSASSVSARHHR